MPLSIFFKAKYFGFKGFPTYRFLYPPSCPPTSPHQRCVKKDRCHWTIRGLILLEASDKWMMMAIFGWWSQGLYIHKGPKGRVPRLLGLVPYRPKYKWNLWTALKIKISDPTCFFLKKDIYFSIIKKRQWIN